MSLILRQIRTCDGACCRESPRFPNVDHSDCVYHDTANGKENAGCMLMRGDTEVPSDGGVSFEGKTTEQVYQETCVEWPQKNSVQKVGDTGGCCWQWVEETTRKEDGN